MSEQSERLSQDKKSGGRRDLKRRLYEARRAQEARPGSQSDKAAKRREKGQAQWGRRRRERVLTSCDDRWPTALPRLQDSSWRRREKEISQVSQGEALSAESMSSQSLIETRRMLKARHDVAPHLLLVSWPRRSVSSRRRKAGREGVGLAGVSERAIVLFRSAQFCCSCRDGLCSICSVAERAKLDLGGRSQRPTLSEQADCSRVARQWRMVRLSPKG